MWSRRFFSAVEALMRRLRPAAPPPGEAGAPAGGEGRPWRRGIFRSRSRPQAGEAPSGRPRPASLSPVALRQLNRLQLSAGRLLPGMIAGQRTSSRRTPALDFREHRAYVPGDDVRFVDWKASARQEHIFVRQGEQPKEAQVYLLLDCSASMAWGFPPKAEAALRLAAALAYLALAHGDRLTLVPLVDSVRVRGRERGDLPERLRSGLLRPLGPLSGKGQVPLAFSYLNALPFHGQVDAARALRTFSRRPGGMTGLVLLVSDLLGASDLGQALSSLPAPAWDVVVFHLLHPDELRPPLRGDYELIDVEDGRRRSVDLTPRALSAYRRRLDEWLASVETLCTQHHARYTLIDSSWPLDDRVIPHLRSVQIVRPF